MSVAAGRIHFCNTRKAPIPSRSVVNLTVYRTAQFREAGQCTRRQLVALDGQADVEFPLHENRRPGQDDDPLRQIYLFIDIVRHTQYGDIQLTTSKSQLFLFMTVLR